MNIIDDRDKRTIYRKLKKREFDNTMTLAAGEKVTRVRLLDEGAVMGLNKPLFYIRRGTLRKYYESLSDDYEGSINLGHMDFATFPFLLGKWTKKDLHLTDIGDGREALDVDLRLDEESLFVKELRRMPYDVGVSAEFAFHEDKENTKKYNLQILDGVNIGNFAIVGECGNVNSSGIRLGGGEGMTLEQMSAALDGNTTDLNAINQKLAALIEEEEKKLSEEPAVEEPVAEEPVAEAEAPAAENKEAMAETEEAAPQEETKELAAVETMFKELTTKLEELSAENAKLHARLEAKEKAERDFVEKFKTLSVSLSTESVAEVADIPAEQNVFTDGIGEI